MMAKSSIQDMSLMTFPFLSMRSLRGGIVIVVLLEFVVGVIISVVDDVDDLFLMLYTDGGRGSRCRPHMITTVRMKK